MKKIINENQWVMLPTNDIEHVIIEKNTGLLLLQTKRKEFSGTKNHLYLTSNEEIKEGVNQYYIDKFTGKLSNSGGAEYGSKQDVVIATTDKSLHNFHTHYGSGKYWEDEPIVRTSDLSKPIIAQIPDFFIKYYVEKQGKVGQTALQYIWINRKRNQPIEEREYELKVSDEKEIMPAIIETEDKIYNREEVIQKGRDLLGHLEIDESDAQEWFDTWVKEIK